MSSGLIEQSATMSSNPRAHISHQSVAQSIRVSAQFNQWLEQAVFADAADQVSELAAPVLPPLASVLGVSPDRGDGNRLGLH